MTRIKERATKTKLTPTMSLVVYYHKYIILFVFKSQCCYNFLFFHPSFTSETLTFFKIKNHTKGKAKVDGTPEKKSKKAYLLFTTKLQPFRTGKNKNWPSLLCVFYRHLSIFRLQSSRFNNTPWHDLVI